MIQKRTQLSVMAVAALAILALAAVMLLAGGVPAQAGSLPATRESATDAPPQPQQTAPEACSATPAAVVSTGHYAYFEVYWDAADKNLASNPCPPAVSVTTHQETDDEGDPTGNTIHSISRAASSINTDSTILHVPGAADLNLRANNAEDYGDWPFLYPDVVKDENGVITNYGAPLGRLVDPTPDEANSGDETYQVWTLPECPHEANSDPGDVDLCLGFSAALLNPADWNGQVQFEFESEREPGLNPENRGAVFVYADDETGGTNEKTLLWDTDDAADTNEMAVTPGAYNHGNWVFTRPGTYVFELHVKGHPNPSLSRSKSVTGVVRHYTFHVGLLSDLSVSVPRVSDATPHIGDSVTFDVRVSNAGPDTATNVKAELTLPAGLTFDPPESDAGTYDSATGVWTVGNLASGAHQDLSLRVNVAQGTHGVPQTLTARVYATEQIGSQVVRELDPLSENNTTSSTVTPTVRPNVNPTFFIERSVAEGAARQSPVGAPIKVNEPDAGNTLTYNLVGDGAADFTVAGVAGGAQISVGPFSLDHETIPSYQLILEVSDGLDEIGNADPSIDDRLPVVVNVTDVENEGVTATLRASPESIRLGEASTFTLSVDGLPEGTQPTDYSLATHDGTYAPTTTTPAVTWEIACAGAGGAQDFAAEVRYQDGEGAFHVVRSNRATVAWTGGSGDRTVCNVENPRDSN